MDSNPGVEQEKAVAAEVAAQEKRRKRGGGRTVDESSLDQLLESLAKHDTDEIARSFYHPIEEFAYLNYAPVRVGGEWCDPPVAHRVQLIEFKRQLGRWVHRLREVHPRSGQALKDLSETPAYKRSRYYETTGDWCRSVEPSRYRQFVESAFPDELKSGVRRLREAADPFATGEPGDQTSTGVGVMGNISQEFIPIVGGPYYRQLYLYAHWEMTSKAFEMRHHSELAKAALDIISDFTLGRGISWKITEPHCRNIWEEFWSRNKMDERLKRLCDDLTWQGELLIRKDQPLAGFLRIRSLDPGAIYEIVTAVEDIETIFFYHAQYPCCAGDTRIPLLNGATQTVAELAERAEPVWLYSYDPETKRIVPGRASKIWKTGEKRCVTVTLDNGESICCSYDHPFLMRDGTTYVEAERLKPGDSLMPLYRKPRYERVWQPESGWEWTHRMVVGEPPKGSVIHHRNDIGYDNRPENLETLTRSEHIAHHNRSIPRFDRMTSANRQRYVAQKKADLTARWQRGDFDNRVVQFSQEERDRRRQMMKDRWSDGERRDVIRKNMSVAALKTWTPERRASQAERMRAHWRDDRKRQITGVRISEGRRKNNHRVVSVEPAGMRVVYDVQVEKYHNFALAAGVFTHNTQYQLPYTDFKGVHLNIPLMKYVITQYPASEIHHIKLNASSSEKWGRSDFFAALGTLKRQRDWTNAASLKDMMQANLVYKLKLIGDSGDLEAFVADPANTALPGPGGTWVENSNLELSLLHEDVAGASRQQGSTGAYLTALFATSMNMPVTYFNESGSGSARATAMAQGEPFAKKILSRQAIMRGLLDHLYEQALSLAVRVGRLDAQYVRQEGSDPEWIFPTLYEEDRGAKFRDLISAKGMAAVSHRTMSTQMASELDLPEYDYETERALIDEERKDTLLSLWPPATGGPEAVGGAIQPDKPVPALQPAAADDGDSREPDDEEQASRHEKIAGADAKSDFRRQQKRESRRTVRSKKRTRKR